MALNDPVPQPGPMAKGGKVTPLDRGFLQRIGEGLKSLFSAPAASSPAGMAANAAPGVDIQSQQPFQTPVWMGPGTSIAPVVPNRADVAGRADDYPVGYNINTQPRRDDSGITFEQLEALAENHDLVALCIATRLDQIGNLTGSFKPRKVPGQQMRPKPDGRCISLDNFMRRPDGRQGFREWLRELTWNQLVFDAATIYVRRSVGGDVYRLEIVKGSTIVPKLDKTGRTPDAPAVAYQQILKGVPAVDYDTNELLYRPRYRRTGKRYGYSVVEQIIMTVNIAIRREVAKLNYFTEGNIPEALCSVPESWTPDQIERFQVVFNALMTDQRAKSKLKFVPGGMRFQQTQNDALLAGAPDEWLARVICFAFSLPPLPLVQMMNRATADTATDNATAEGLQPIKLWLKDILDHIAQVCFGYDDLEYVYDDIEDVDAADQEQRDIELVRAGMKSIDDYLIDHGRDPIGMGPAIFGIGPLGVMFVEDLLKAQQQGLTMPQPPPPPDMGGGMGMPPGAMAPPAAAMPQQGGGFMPAASAAVAPISPNLLAAVGLGAGGPSKRRVDITQADQQASDPLSRAVVHPNVLATLRSVERRQGRSRAR